MNDKIKISEGILYLTKIKTKTKDQKIKNIICGYTFVLLLLTTVQIIGIFFFSKGFLLSKNVISNISNCKINGIDICSEETKFSKIVLILIDGLRYDFVIPIKNSDKPYHNKFPILYELAQKKNGLLLKFISDPPTTTLQRLKGLTTGSLPTFIDFGDNFDSDEINEDNWLLQLNRNKKKVGVIGDDTWYHLFKKYIDTNLNFPFESLNLNDFDKIDFKITNILNTFLNKNNTSKWDFLISHFLGVDHIGHKFSPNSQHMNKKLIQMNNLVESTISKLDNNTLLIVMGDHGMDDNGNHGGDSLKEVETAIFFYSKNYVFQKKNQGSYDIKDNGKFYRSVNQIDLVSTLSLILGLPIPHNNLGFPIYELFNKTEYSKAIFKTIMQIHHYRNFTEKIPHSLSNEFDVFIKNQTLNINNNSVRSHSIEWAQIYQKQFLMHCVKIWNKFNLRLMFIGLFILLLFTGFMIIYSRLIPSIRLLIMSFEFIGSIAVMSFFGLIIVFSINFIFNPYDFELKKSLLLGLALGMLAGLWSPLIDKFGIVWLFNQLREFFVFSFNGWSFLGILFLCFHTFIFTSNSYIVWEDKLVQFLINTFGFCCMYSCIGNNRLSKMKKILGLMNSLIFIIISRSVSLIVLCREEQIKYCSSTFKNSWWSLLILYLITILTPKSIEVFYNLTNSFHKIAKIWIYYIYKSFLIMISIYWTSDIIQSSNFFINLNSKSLLSILKHLKLETAKIVMISSLILANYFWTKSSLCIKLLSNKNQENYSLILGSENIYGSSYFLSILNFAAAISLVMKPLGIVSINLLLIQILSLINLLETLQLRRNLIGPVIMSLMGFQHFFSTGHQSNFASVQWDLAFITNESLFFPFNHLNVLLNTFGAFFLTCLSVPLITLWKIPFSKKPITVLSQIITNLTTMITYHSILGFSNSFFIIFLRRHLMVWKIFAPRFMLTYMLLIFINFSVIFFSFLFTSNISILKVNKFF